MRKRSSYGVGVLIGILMTLCVICAAAIGLKAWRFLPSNEPQTTSTAAAQTLPGVTQTTAPETTVSAQPNSTVTLLAVGDNLIDEDVITSGGSIYMGNLNYEHLYEHVKADIEAADIAVISQETVFVSEVLNSSGEPQYGSPRAVGEAVADAGFDVILHASEHATDKSVENVFDAIDFWSDKNITVLGIHKTETDAETPTVLEKNGISIGMVNYTKELQKVPLGDNEQFAVDLCGEDDTKLMSDLAYCEQNADITVAFLHVGNLQSTEPVTYVQVLVTSCINQGADIIICTHPYAPQPYEEVTRSDGSIAYVYYSLGSFVSAQEGVDNILSGMAAITIQKSGDVTTVAESTLTPLVTHGAAGTDFSVYKLSDYTDELASENTLADCTLAELTERFDELTK